MSFVSELDERSRDHLERIFGSGRNGVGADSSAGLAQRHVAEMMHEIGEPFF